MSAKNFILKTIELYHEARLPAFPDLKIRRGRSRSISSLIEDLFAKFLVKNITCDKIYVDQPISIAGVKAQRYPDISIVKNEVITSFCDLKTDLGWNRNSLVDLCKNHYDWVKKIQGSRCKLKDGVTKKVSSYKINKDASYNVVILSEHNINPEKLEIQIARAHELFYPAVEVFVLTSGIHLNEYGMTVNELIEKADIKDQIFKKLLIKLSKN